MKLFVKKVRKNYGKLGEVCHEAWIDGFLESGLEIEIFDPDCRVPTKFENHFIEVLISIYHLKKKKAGRGVFQGKYLGYFKIPEEWLEYDNHLKKYHLEGNNAIQTQDGIFLIDGQGLKDNSVEIGTNIKFNGTRYDLYSWYPIE